MVLIFSKSEFEISTESVIDWIQSAGHLWKRINGVDLENYPLRICLDNNSDTIEINGHILNREEIKVIWFRRWHDTLPYKELRAYEDEASYQVKAHFGLERRKLRQLLFDTFEEVMWLSYPNERFNKFLALRKAKKVGLEIPATYILNNRKELESVLGKDKRFITKSISDSPIYFSGKDAYLLYTSLFMPDTIEIEYEMFFPTLFQSCIDKEYELRIFYLGGVCYSMAIFSQQDDDTKHDFRVYNKTKPNRYVPYKLPDVIEIKIAALMRELNLETGSIDMIKSTIGKYIFLEVNPDGQFGMTSAPCNYFLEKRIANYLITKDKF